MAEVGAREIRIDHVFDAPREAVFAAWVDPDQVARWWAPGGLEVPRESVEIEPRVGGAFRLTMVESRAAPASRSVAISSRSTRRS
jgi:uncharacterized protein YndB with AHSA1/START domain